MRYLKIKKAAVQNNRLKIEKKARILKENIANIKCYVWYSPRTSFQPNKNILVETSLKYVRDYLK